MEIGEIEREREKTAANGLAIVDERWSGIQVANSDNRRQR